MPTSCLINSLNLKVWKRTGTEGPPCDRYHFEEYEIRGNGCIKVHVGLDTWVDRGMGGRRGYLRPVGDEDGVAINRVDSIISEYCDYTILQLERFARKARSRCRGCGSRRFEEVRGYPGESMTACTQCSRISSSWYNEGAVI
jgi:hypothetical protein